MKEKKCSKCGEVKTILFFSKHCTALDGLRSYCRECGKKEYEKRKNKPKIIITEKKCTSCFKVKPIINFRKDIISKDGFDKNCTSCKKKEYKIKHGNTRTVDLSPEGFKKCGCCHEVKSHNNFGNNKSTYDGKAQYCKPCFRNKNNDRYKNNRESVLKERVVFHQKNKDRLNAKSRNNRLLNGDHIRALSKLNRATKKEAISIQGKKYREKNSQKIRTYQNGYEKKRIKEDPNFKLRKTLRHRILNALKKQGTIKKGSTIDIMGCTLDEAREHIEKQFNNGMSWGNHGVWEIDHIIPCASFDLTDTEQQRKCFHYSNLQPLMAMENRIKGAKIL